MTKKSAIDASKNADEIEADVCATGSRPLADAYSDDVVSEDELNERYGWQADINLEPWAQVDTVKDSVVSLVQEEIERRKAALGLMYPFEVVGNSGSLAYRSGAGRTGVYEFCLAIATTRHSLQLNPYAIITREFERLIGQLLKAFLGPGAVYYRLGAPPDNDRPGRMIDALMELKEKTCGEFVFSQTTDTEKRVQGGDDGIDIVAWRPLGDKRAGKLMLLAQCACGNDWPSKVKDLDPDVFNRNWCGHISRAGQLRCMAIPWHIPHPEEWTDKVDAAGILLDRCRLTWLAETLLTDAEANELRLRLEGYTATLSAPAVVPVGKKTKSATGPATKKRRPTQRRQ